MKKIKAVIKVKFPHLESTSTAVSRLKKALSFEGKEDLDSKIKLGSLIKIKFTQYEDR